MNTQTSGSALVSFSGSWCCDNHLKNYDGSVNDLQRAVGHDKGFFVRISYTNNGAHPRAHCWYPLWGVETCGSDFRIESEYQEGYRTYAEKGVTS